MTVTVAHEGHIRIITINRPEARNAINRETRAGLEKAFNEFAVDPDAWVAILTAAGDKAFSAGADLKEMDPAQRADPDYVAPPFGFIRRAMERSRVDLPQPLGPTTEVIFPSGTVIESSSITVASS